MSRKDDIMLINHPGVMCVGVIPPKEWEFEGNKGITYKVQLSDGSETVNLKCASADVWGVFKGFQQYAVSIELKAAGNGVKAEIVGAQPVKA